MSIAVCMVVKDEALGTFGVPHVGTREFVG